MLPPLILINVVLYLNVVLSTRAVWSVSGQYHSGSSSQHAISNHHQQNPPIMPTSLSNKTAGMVPIQILFHIPNISSFQQNDISNRRHASKSESDNMFRCLNDNRFISMENVCDGISQCLNGSDEGDFCKDGFSLIVQKHRGRVYHLFVSSMIIIVITNSVLIGLVCLHYYRIHKAKSSCIDDNAGEVVELGQYCPFSNTTNCINSDNLQSNKSNNENTANSRIDSTEKNDTKIKVDGSNRITESANSTNAGVQIKVVNVESNQNIDLVETLIEGKQNSVLHSTPTRLKQTVNKRANSASEQLIGKNEENVIMLQEDTTDTDNLQQQIKQTSCNNCNSFTTALCECKSKASSKSNLLANNCCSKIDQDGSNFVATLNGSTNSSQTGLKTCCNCDAGTNQIILRPITIVRLLANSQ